jgi:hypothetical protein
MRLAPLFSSPCLAAACSPAAAAGPTRPTRAPTSTSCSKDTFSGNKDIKSGQLDLALDASSRPAALNVKVAGRSRARERQGARARHRRILDGGGQSFEAASPPPATGVRELGGTTTRSPAPSSGSSGRSQQCQQAGAQNQNSRWPRSGSTRRSGSPNAKNAGEAKVGDTDTIKITGDVDLPKLLGRPQRRAREAPLARRRQARNLPDQLPTQRKSRPPTREGPRVEIYTAPRTRSCAGWSRMKLAAQARASAADLSFDLQLLDLNEEPGHQAPDNAKPFAARRRSSAASASAASGAGSGRRSGSGRAEREPREVLAVHPGRQRRQHEDPQVRGPADAVAPDAA